MSRSLLLGVFIPQLLKMSGYAWKPLLIRKQQNTPVRALTFPVRQLEESSETISSLFLVTSVTISSPRIPHEKISS